jgi:hypothetical protein
VIKFKLVLFFILLFNNVVFSQQRIDIVAKNKTILSVISDLKKNQGLNFFYSNNLEDLQKKVNLNLKQVTVKEGLTKLFANTNLAFKFVGDQILVKRKEEIDLKDDEWIVPVQTVISSPKVKPIEYRISGFVYEKESKEVLLYADVLCLENRKRTNTNAYGFFSLLLEKGEQTVIFRYSNLITDTISLNLTKDTVFNIELEADQIIIPTIVISSSDNSSLFKDLDNKNKIDIDKPLASGSIINDDIIDNVKFQPGVNSKNEGSTGYIIRGGGLDQNLILLDGAPIMNESHFLGLVSIFNSQAIKNVTLYKSGIPAKYGSRLSSILDINMKDGNMRQIEADVVLNPFISGLTVEGPIKKDTCSMLFSTRTSLLNLWLKQPIQSYLNVEKFNFFDLNGKVNYKLNDRNRLYVSAYYGKDNFKTNSKLLYTNEKWGNSTSSIRWSHIYSDKLFGNLNLIYSNYNYHNEEVFDQVNYYMNSKINSFILKKEFSYYYSNQHKFSFGVQTQFSTYTPGNEAFFDNYYDSTTQVHYEFESNLKLKFNNTLESALYIQDDYKYSDKIDFMLGLRLSTFNHIGKGYNFEFGPNYSVDSISKSGIYNLYGGFEPRFRINYKYSPQVFLHGTYDRTYQYMMLASNSISRSPTDVWIPATNNITPQSMNQFTLGVSSMLDKFKTIVSSNIFYKHSSQVIDYIDNAFLKLNQQIESQIKQGKSNAYGLEIGILKQSGDFTFSSNYLLSRVKYIIPEINNGVAYFAPHDKLHSFNTNFNYKLTPRIQLQSNFVISSGTRTTLPDAIYEVLGTQFIHYGERNKDKLPVYHRLDLSINYHGKEKKHYRIDGSFSIYNVYNRKNPYSITFEKQSTTAFYNYLLPFLPSFTIKIHIQ